MPPAVNDCGCPDYENLFAFALCVGRRYRKTMAAKAAAAYGPAKGRLDAFGRRSRVRINLIVAVLRREMRGIVIALLFVLATTAVALFLRHYIGILRGAVLYLVPVMLAGYQFGVIPALVAAVAGVLLSGYVYFAQLYSFQVASPQEALNLLLFMIVAVVVSHLSSQAKKHILIARKREREMSDLYAFSRRLAMAPSAAEIFVAIQEHLANLVQRKVVLLGIADAGTADDVPETVRAAVTRVEHDEGLERTVEDGTGNVWLIRRVSPKTPDFGLVAVDLGNVLGQPLTDMRQRIDDALADAAATLERLDVARALNEAKMRSETELLREALIGSVSHELRTPLASILGAATVLHNAPALAGDPRLLALTSVVRDEAERLNIDIQNLLDATTITRQQVRPKLQWVEPVDIVNAAFEHRRRRLSGFPVTFDLHSNLPIVHVDPAQVEQALVQIIDNAAKYSPAGSPIRVAAHPNGQTVMLSVHDSGSGLTTEEKRQVGGRFFRGPRHKVTTSGSGLGLWIANAFVTANGGKVEVESDGADRGTTVTIHLPMSPEAEQMETTVDE
jgi:two-component system, OmpR family, sensor histidine kinase KdpD